MRQHICERCEPRDLYVALAHRFDDGCVRGSRRGHCDAVTGNLRQQSSKRLTVRCNSLAIDRRGEYHSYRTFLRTKLARGHGYRLYVRVREGLLPGVLVTPIIVVCAYVAHLHAPFRSERGDIGEHAALE